MGVSRRCHHINMCAWRGGGAGAFWLSCVVSAAALLWGNPMAVPFKTENVCSQNGFAIVVRRHMDVFSVVYCFIQNASAHSAGP